PDGKLRPGMTATVRAVSARHDGVLRVPSAALRFRPAPELIEKGSGGAGGGPGAGSGAAMAAEGRGGSGRGRPGGGRGGGDGQGRWSKVYLPHGSQVAPVRFKPGIAD